VFRCREKTSLQLYAFPKNASRRKVLHTISPNSEKRRENTVDFCVYNLEEINNSISP
jgi:hypothetical protein